MSKRVLIFDRHYQDEGRDFIAATLSQHGNQAVILADDPGLGKTRQTLMAADMLHVRRMLVVAPVMARTSWPIEIAKFSPERLPHLRVVQPGDKPGDWLDNDDLIVVFSYDTFSQPRTARLWLPYLLAHHFDLLVLDEGHYLKNASNRTQAIYGRGGNPHGSLRSVCDKVLLLTGTLCPNHAAEFYQHYRAFWPERLQRNNRPWMQSEFEEHFTWYRDTQWGRNIIGSRNQAQMRTLFADVILRRRKDEVLLELPPLQVEDVPLSSQPIDDTPATRAVARHLNGLEDAELLAALSRESTQLSTVRRELGERKAPLAGAWIAERLDCGVPKMLVFAWHTGVIATLTSMLVHYHPLTITGSTSSRDRTRAVEEFQTDPARRVLIGQILAAGSAVTLTAAADVAVVEPSWVPGENAQAISRAHRMGQQNRVLASFLYLRGSLDEAIMRAFRRKASEIAELYLQGTTIDVESRNPCDAD